MSKRFHRTGSGRWSALLPVGKVLKAGVNRVIAVTRGRAGDTGTGSERIVVAKRGATAGYVRIARGQGSRAVHLKLADSPVLLGISLNGRSVAGLFKRGAAGLQQSMISPDDGLRYGRNTLIARVALRDGRSIRRKVSFRVPRSAPLAAAGLDRRVRVGQTVKFSAKRSKAIAGKLSFEWKIKRAPKGSKAKLSGAKTARPSLRGDKNGRYIVELAARGSGGTARDRVTVDVQPQYPRLGARLNTAVKQADGSYALEIGSNCDATVEQNCTKIVEPYGSNPVMIVALDRNTLEVRDVVHLNGTAAAGAVALNEMVQFAGSSGDPDSMVVLSALPNMGVQASAFEFALSVLGGVLPRLGSSGGFAAIGVPVTDLNLNRYRTGWVNGGNTTAGSQVTGSLQGYLQYDYSNDRYAYLTGQSDSYDTSTAASTSTQNVMRVGSSTYSSDALPGDCTGAVQLVIVRAATLTPGSAFPASQTFYTNCSDSGATNAAITDFNGAIGTVAGSVDSGDDGPLLVFVQTIGQPFPLNPSQQELNLLAGAAGAVEQLGGTDEVFNDAIATSGAKYALAGSTSLLADAPSNPAGQAYAPEATTLQSNNGGTLDGVLKYDRFSAFQPVSGVSNVGQTGFWSDLSFQPATPWPYSTTDGEKNALAYISSKYNIQYSPSSSCYKPVRPDVRFEYCDLNAPWGTLLDNLPTIKTAPAGCGCNQTEWTNVSGQIVSEVHMVRRVYRYVGYVQEIYGRAGSAGAFDVATLGSQVESAVNPPSKSGIFGSWLALTGDITNALSVLPGEEAVGDTIDAVSALSYVFSDGLTENNGTGTLGDMVNTVASELPSETANRYLAASEQFGHLGDIVVTDYGKLLKAGTSTQIQIDEDTITGGINQLMIGGYRFAYKRLLGVAYNNYGLPYTDLSPNAATPQDYVCYTAPGYYDKVKPFNSAGTGGWITQNSNNPGISVFGGQEPIMLALGEKDSSTAIEVRTPPSKLVGPMVQPISYTSQGIPKTFGEFAPWWQRHDFKQEMFSCTN